MVFIFSVKSKPIFISVVFLIFATGGLTSSFYHKSGKKNPLSLGFKFLRKRPHMLPSGSHVKAVPCTELFIYTCASKMELISRFSPLYIWDVSMLDCLKSCSLKKTLFIKNISKIMNKLQIRAYHNKM